MDFPVRLCVDGVALPLGTGPRLVNTRKVQVTGIWCSKFLMAATTQKKVAASKAGACSFVKEVCHFCSV